LTRAAVQKLQEKYGIAKEGDAGYGVVGPKTRAKINELIGGESSMPSLSMPPPVALPGATATATAAALSIDQILKQIEAIQNQINQLKGQ
ncbi:MAG: hypothetical protein G01um101433_458, partial [Parcubacteria group bacterium Gr01-1014_33]